MSTLHQYKWAGVTQFKAYLSDVGPNDNIIIYGKFTSQDQSSLLNFEITLKDYCFWLTETEALNENFNHINYDQWLNLITQHDKTRTWK